MIDITATIEHDGRDARLLSTFGNGLADDLCRFDIAARFGPQIFLGSRCSRQSLSGLIVNYLGVNVIQAAKHR